MEWLHTLACPMPKGMLAFVVAVVAGFFRFYWDAAPSYPYEWKFFLWLLAVVVGGALLAYFPLAHFCAA